MSTIALSGTSLNYTMGMGAFEGLGKAFSNTKRTSGGLCDALKTLKSKIDIASAAAKVDTLQERAQKAQARESEKTSSLTLAYEKLDTLIRDTGTIDLRVSSKISSREDDFYKRYNYLKPECKKSVGEKICDAWAEGWRVFKNILCGVGNAIANIAKKVWDWCKDHVAIFTAIVVIAAAIILATFLGPAAIIAICSAIAFFCTAADLVATLITGNDIYTLLMESGHPILAELFAGLEWGASIAAVALSFYELGTQIAKIGFKNFLTGGEKNFANIMKYHFKNIVNGIKADIKSIFGSGLKVSERLKATWNIIVFNQSGDFSLKESILSYKKWKEGISLFRAKKVGSKSKNVKWIDDQFYAQDKSDLYKWLLDNFPDDDGEIKIVNKNGYIDFDYDHYNFKKVGEGDFMQIYAKYKDTMFDSNGSLILSEDEKRRRIWKNAGIEKDKIPDLTHHEVFLLHGGKVDIYDLPTVFHRSIGHYGGIQAVTEIWKQLGKGTLFMPERMVVGRSLMDLLANFVF